MSKDGSGPRNTVAKMFVREDEVIFETISGGGLEYQVQKLAVEAASDLKPQIIELRLDSDEVAKDEDICGGVVEVFLEPVLKKHYEVLQSHR